MFKSPEQTVAREVPPCISMGFAPPCLVLFVMVSSATGLLDPTILVSEGFPGGDVAGPLRWRFFDGRAGSACLGEDGGVPPPQEPTPRHPALPASNLPFLSRVAKKVVTLQLQGVLEEADGLDPSQLSFGLGRAAERALTVPADGLCGSQEGGGALVLVPSDLSAAVGAVDRGILPGFRNGGHEGRGLSPLFLICRVPQRLTFLPSCLASTGSFCRHGVRYHRDAEDPSWVSDPRWTT